MLQFVKMHGAGNDYVYVDCFRQPVPADPSALARALSDRHTGIGGDGLVLIVPPRTGRAAAEEADHAPGGRGSARLTGVGGPAQPPAVRMRMFNADGSEAEMCGNAIRCVAKYAAEQGLVQADEFPIETAAGVLTVALTQRRAGKVTQVRVNMGRPVLTGREIPTTLPGDPPIGAPLDVDGRRLDVTCVSMGNPHCVVFVDEITDEWVLEVGPRIERHAAFPNRVNVEFIQVLSPGEFHMRVWERGSGETLACGTGACAAAVAGVLTERTARQVVAHLRGGDLTLQWTESGEVLMTGPAVEVFRGEWPGTDG